MRITYFYINFDGLGRSVTQKVLSEVQNLMRYDVKIKIYIISPRRIEYPSNILVTSRNMECLDRSDGKINYIRILKCDNYINAQLKKIILSLEQDDIVYMRFPYPSYAFLNALKMPRKCKIITEHQTKEVHENRLSKKYLYLIIDALFGNAIRKNLDGIVGVTEEITNYEIGRAGILNKPHITIGNGFDIKTVKIRKTPPFDNSVLHLLCVANVSPWHGLDRLLLGIMQNKENKKKVFLHIAGDGAELQNLIASVRKRGVQDQVVFYGHLTGEKLDELFDTCHIAVGSLGLHRIGLNEASILKVREYCARGIPYIIACADPDFPDDFPYIHRISPDESPVDIEKIIEFSQKVYADLDHPQKMRAFALEHLDWSVKMKKLKAFLETLVAESKLTS